MALYVGNQKVCPVVKVGGGGTTINNQNKTITVNGTYTADSGYTGLGEVTVNVPQEGASGELVTLRKGIDFTQNDVRVDTLNLWDLISEIKYFRDEDDNVVSFPLDEDKKIIDVNEDNETITIETMQFPNIIYWNEDFTKEFAMQLDL